MPPTPLQMVGRVQRRLCPQPKFFSKKRSKMLYFFRFKNIDQKNSQASMKKQKFETLQKSSPSKMARGKKQNWETLQKSGVSKACTSLRGSSAWQSGGRRALMRWMPILILSFRFLSPTRWRCFFSSSWRYAASSSLQQSHTNQQSSTYQYQSQKSIIKS